jgi:crotonobetainyl-CoA:carnitine CoA-transferase CaiB-like acyl-CoA transferase
MTDEPPWLTMSEAAAQSGLHRDAIRSRARRGLIPSKRGNRGQWLVQLTAAAMATSDQGDDHDLAMVVADLQAEVTELREALARAEATRDAAMTTAKATVETKDILIIELQKMLAETRRGWLERLLEAVRRR